MSATLTTMDGSTGAAVAAKPAGWLYRPSIDLTILGLPILVAIGAIGIEASHGLSQQRIIERTYALFLAQYVLGNTTHVILTFLLFGLRRDLLSPVKGQKEIIVFGSLATFGASFALFWLTSVTFPMWVDFGVTIGFIFSQHHRLSQVKGIWALYSLRAKQPPAPLERKIQQSFVPLGLLLLTARLLMFPRASTTTFAVLVPIPGEPPPFPFWAVYVLLAGYAVYAAIGAVSLFRAGASRAKKIYVITQLVMTGVAIYSPIWGNIIMSGVHGLEYYFLSARMLKPRDGEGLRLSRAGIWGVMLLAMSPAIVVGVMNTPIVHALIVEPWPLVAATMVLNSIVMAHYFADAFLYRLRIPEVRKVVLGRLGF
jgi:hypothetical protein